MLSRLMLSRLNADYLSGSIFVLGLFRATVVIHGVHF